MFGRLIGFIGISPLRFYIYIGLMLAFLAFCGTLYMKGYLNCKGDVKIDKANAIIEGKKADDKLEKEIVTGGHDALIKRAARWMYD